MMPIPNNSKLNCGAKAPQLLLNNNYTFGIVNSKYTISTIIRNV